MLAGGRTETAAGTAGRSKAVIRSRWCLAAELAERCPNDVHQRRHGIRLLQPSNRGGGCGAPLRFVVGVRACKDAANSLQAEKIERGIYPIRIAPQAYVHDR